MILVDRKRLWLRVYRGGTASHRRCYFWKFDGLRGRNYGWTLRWSKQKEKCIGVQMSFNQKRRKW